MKSLHGVISENWNFLSVFLIFFNPLSTNNWFYLSRSVNIFTLNLSADFSIFTLMSEAAGSFHLSFSNYMLPEILSNAALALMIHRVVKIMNLG